MQRESLPNIQLQQPERVTISSDARIDSPGFLAQYCTSTFMESSTKKIVQLEILDVRDVRKILSSLFGTLGQNYVLC